MVADLLRGVETRESERGLAVAGLGAEKRARDAGPVLQHDADRSQAELESEETGAASKAMLDT